MGQTTVFTKITSLLLSSALVLSSLPSIASAHESNIHFQNGYESSNNSYDFADSEVLDHGLNKQAFNPHAGNILISYQLNQPEQVTVEILGYGEQIRLLTEDAWKSANTVHSVSWSGTNKSGKTVESGKYKYRISLANGNQYYGDIVVAYNGPTQQSHQYNYYQKQYGNNGYHIYSGQNQHITGNKGNLNIYGEKASPSVFDPDDTSSKITYTLSESAKVTVDVFKGNEHISNLIQSRYQSAGKHALYWDGEHNSGELVEEGIYTIEIKAKKAAEKDIERVFVEVDFSSPYKKKKQLYKSQPRVYELKASPQTFNPYKEKTKLSYKLGDYGRVTVRINDHNKTIKVIKKDDYQKKGYNHIKWNGKNKFGQFVPEGPYKYVIRYTNKYGESTESSGHIIVDYQSYKHTYNQNKKKLQVVSNANTYNYDYYDFNNESQGKCGNFKDVQKYSKYCDAIEFVKQNHIFNGYDNGYFYPNKAIQRDEALRVAMGTFGVEAVPVYGENLGFLDVDVHAWYMPYLKAAQILEIIHGYPGNLFKPYQPMNRVEFTKVFLESARATQGIYIPECTEKPYADTQMTWYKDYVCYAKEHKLIKTVDAFHYQPGKLITRGEAAEFVYNFYNN